MGLPATVLSDHTAPHPGGPVRCLDRMAGCGGGSIPPSKVRRACMTIGAFRAVESVSALEWDALARDIVATVAPEELPVFGRPGRRTA